MKTYKIQINSRVDLWVSDQGFQFTNSRPTNDWISWDQFKWYWKPYEKDGIKQKIYKFVDTLSDHHKNRPFYAGLKFEE